MGRSLTKVSMRSTPRAALALAAAGALLSCGGTASPPTDFGVNVTVDAKALKATTITAAKKGSLRVVVNMDPPQPPKTFDVSTAIASRELRFHYTPPAGTKATDKLAMVFEVLDGAGNTIASGSAKAFPLAAKAVDVTIKLEDGSSSGDGGTDGGNDGGSGKGNGTACLVGTDCDSGFCADGVCCNEKCDDVCVSCDQATTKGTCTPFAMNTDPEMECREVVPPPPPMEDAGAPASDAAAGDGPAAADAAKPATDAGAADAGASDAVMINPPDGGFMSTPKMCAGTCSGARSCKYPGKEKTCGKGFCNNPDEPGGFVCDGAGSCNIELTKCPSYACDDATGACGTQCTGHEDCVKGYYCAANAQCLPRKNNSVACASDPECKSGHCASGVCCNTACSGMGLSCNDPGKTGQCVCQGVTCAAGVACQVFYQDMDADTYGNRNGTIAAGTAKAGCMGSPPPAGFVADNTDCDDSDAMAHPGQTMFFPTQRKSGGFDYDCDDKITKETPEYPGAVCHFCGAVGSCEPGSSTCTTANETASWACPQEYGGIIRAGLPPGATLPAGSTLVPMSIDPDQPITGKLAADPAFVPTSYAGAVLPPPICKICVLQCCGCQVNDKTGFRQVVPCGVDTVSVFTCGSCSVAGGGVSAPTAGYRRQQCR